MTITLISAAPMRQAIRVAAADTSTRFKPHTVPKSTRSRPASIPTRRWSSRRTPNCPGVELHSQTWIVTASPAGPARSIPMWNGRMTTVPDSACAATIPRARGGGVRSQRPWRPDGRTAWSRVAGVDLRPLRLDASAAPVVLERGAVLLFGVGFDSTAHVDAELAVLRTFVD